MKQHHLHIQLRSTEGAVLRALGLMERRGYRMESCTVGDAQGDGRAMRVCVVSDRPESLLKKQLERLHDVLWVELEQQMDGPAAKLSDKLA